MKFAIIGCEHAHIEIFIQEMLELGHELAGIHEREDNALALSLAKKYETPLVSDRDSLLAQADLIGSSAVNNEKIDMIELCERHGKPIMIDKPAVTNRRDLERLQAAMERGAIEIGMLLTERFHSPVYTLKRLIDRGTLGQLATIGMRKPHRLNASARPQWFFSKAQCGGIVVDLLIHDYDLLRWLTGKEVVRSQGNMTKRILPEYPEFYDSASVQVVMQGGVTAQLYADWYTPSQSWTWGDGRIFVTGTEGFAELRLSGDPFAGREAMVLVTTNSRGPEQVALETPPTTITEDFLLRLESKPSILTGRDIVFATKAAVEADERVDRIRLEEDEHRW
ncbi:Gfo/Idh/MocA family protein [Paenibacillus methanolicus]|uniref:Putative dehydrogenase n=1 Tax=Paenibacillus methanolicus TaxID=582686 RepID=A0A5S5CL04_9BACL|nr:Gfo/Idh/MocA family oxidoreductase [Paenibacillus methanolicus]TYP79395.1 putative dehydrogenase [Paenibacillus methanolicus]